MRSCVHRKQTAMWLLGDSTRSLKTKLEEGRAESHIISRMEDLTLSSTHMTQSSAHNSTVFRSPSSDGFAKVSHTQTDHTWPSVCQLSVVPWCVCFVHQSEVGNSGPGLTQGDKLRALKNQRASRPATTGALRYQNLNSNTDLLGSVFQGEICRTLMVFYSQQHQMFVSV